MSLNNVTDQAQMNNIVSPSRVKEGESYETTLFICACADKYAFE